MPKVGSDIRAGRTHKGDEIPPTVWPEAAPSTKEEMILTISCGNSHIHWAYHDGYHKKFVTQLFWRTPLLAEADFGLGKSPCEDLSCQIPEAVHEFIFGAVGADPTHDNALQASLKRDVPTLSVYIVSTNKEQNHFISYIFQDIPSRLYVMQPDDFFSKKQGRYEGMGIDRCVALRAAGARLGFPVLVIDGGTAATYTAADKDGNIIGGGIGPGLLAKFRSLAAYTSALPTIHYEDFLNEMNQMLSEGKKFPVFATNTKQAIIGDILLGTAQKTQCIINHFSHKVMSVKNTDDNAERDINVVVTGGDAELINTLLKPNDSNTLIERDPLAGDAPNVNVTVMKYAIHIGMATVLSAQTEKRTQEMNDIDFELIGQRVAKRFQMVDKTGTHIYRGNIASVSRDSDGNVNYYQIRYDDGDAEEMGVVACYEALVLYGEVGEKETDLVRAATETTHKPKQPVGEKVIKAKVAASELARVDPKVKASVEKKRAAEKAAVAQKKPSSPKRAAPPHPAEKTPRKKKKEEYVGLRAAKFFDDDLPYFGVVTAYMGMMEGATSVCWHVHFDDNDGEDLEITELTECIELAQEYKSQDQDRKWRYRNGKRGKRRC